MKNILSWYLYWFPIFLFAQAGKDCDALYNSGVHYEAERDLVRSEQTFREAMACYEASVGKRDSNYIKALGQHARTIYQMRDVETAQKEFFEALQLWDENVKVSSSNHYIILLNNTGSILANTGKYKEAMLYFLKAKDATAKLYGAEHWRSVNSLIRIGTIYLNEGKLEEALPYFFEAQTVSRRDTSADMLRYAVQSASFLGNTYRLMGWYNQAENLLLSNKERLAQTPPTADLALRNLHDLAMLYATMPDKNAQPYYEDLLQRLEQSDNPLWTFMSQVYVDYGSFLSGQNQLEQAEAVLKKGLRIETEALNKQNQNYPIFLQNLATVYIKNDQIDQALPLLQEVLAVYVKRQVEKEMNLSQTHLTLSEIYVLKNDWALAWLHIQKGLAANSKNYLPDSSQKEPLPAFIDTLDRIDYYSKEEALSAFDKINDYLLARHAAEGEARHLEVAYGLQKTVLRFLERRRGEALSEQDKLGQSSASAKIIVQGVAVLARLQALFPERDFLPDFFSLAEQNKALLLNEALRSQQARRFGYLPDTLARLQDSLHTRIDELEKSLLEAGDPAKQAALRQALNQANMDLERFKKQLEQNHPDYFEYQYKSGVASVAQIQALLPERSALIEYLVSDTAAYALCLTAGRARLVELPGGDSLAHLVKMLRRCLTDYEALQHQPEKAYEEYVLYAYRAYQTLVAPLLDSLDPNIEQLVIIPDAELAHLPFEAFLQNLPDKTLPYNQLPYLINRYAISYSYSSTLLAENLQRPLRGRGNMLAMAADYSFKGDSLTLSRRSVLQNLKRQTLDELPAARKEVEELKNLYKGEFMTGAAATENAFKVRAAQYGILHLAMHGLLDRHNPILSSLAFTEDGDSLEDNFLESWEISHLGLQADLVVLSACETGYGKFRQGEGVMSLARSFMYAGVPSLLVSLWEVNDASTSRLMQAYYAELATGVDKAQALRQAKLKYIAQARGTAAHPAFWSPFVQLGDTRPVALSGKGWGLWRWLLGGGALAAAVLLWRRYGKRKV